MQRSVTLAMVWVTAAQMQQIEAQLFAVGMPVAALMERAVGAITQRLCEQYPLGRVGVLVGPGHNGGDALGVARSLSLRGVMVQIYCPFERLKSLTAQHRDYAAYLGIPFVTSVAALAADDLIVDGLFGCGLTQPLQGEVVTAIEQINQFQQAGMPVVSIDLPSGLHTDRGEPLGIAIQASQTYCLGLWKQAFVQGSALAYVGNAELIDIDLPLGAIASLLGTPPTQQRLTAHQALAALPLSRPALAHKYTVGHLFLIAGSRQYGGAVLLAGKAAIASGVGMLTLAVPASLRSMLQAALPSALVLGCPESAAGNLIALPSDLDWSRYQAIACGPGLTQAATAPVWAAMATDLPLVLDADGLNILARQDTVPSLKARAAPTILTPHAGEFRRLFPKIEAHSENLDPLAQAQTAAQLSGSLLVYKGAQTVIASPDGRLWVNPQGTPALARGGSGDVLTGLLGGLLAQLAIGKTADEQTEAAVDAALGGVWWHNQTALALAQQRTVLGVDPSQLTQALNPTLQSWLNKPLARYDS